MNVTGIVAEGWLEAMARPDPQESGKLIERISVVNSVTPVIRIEALMLQKPRCSLSAHPQCFLIDETP